MSAARDELAQIIAYNVRNGLAGEDVHTPYAEIDDAADAIIAAGYIKPDLTDADRRERAQDAILDFNGTPRRELFEYPYRADESRELIAGADRVVTAVLDAMLSTRVSE